MASRLLIVGVPRSGSSWLARALGSASDCCVVFEPDNAHIRPYALKAKRGLADFPVLTPGDTHARFDRLWRFAADRSHAGAHSIPLRFRRRVSARLFSQLSPDDVRDAIAGRPNLTAWLVGALSAPVRPSAARVVLKTVYGSLSMEWIAQRVNAPVVVLHRDPCAVVSSWLRMGWTERTGWRVPREFAVRYTQGDGRLPQADAPLSPTEWIAWNVCTLLAHQDAVSCSVPMSYTVDHESICADPHRVLRELARAVSWTWSASIDTFIRDSDRPGDGYETNRRMSEAASAWRRHLTSRQVQAIRDIQSRFPALRRWT